jgi:hypothetical protein
LVLAQVNSKTAQISDVWIYIDEWSNSIKFPLITEPVPIVIPLSV